MTTSLRTATTTIGGHSQQPLRPESSTKHAVSAAPSPAETITAGRDIRLTNADCAEDFDICGSEQIEPGTVVVLGEEGKLEQSHKAYEKRVAGVVSGAGGYKAAL
jgi:hypothetical protein